MEDAGTVATRWAEAYNTHDAERIRAVLAADATLTGPEGTFNGEAAITQYMAAWIQAFGGGYTIHHVTTEGDTAIVESTWRGTHTGPYATPNGDIAPTGRAIEERSCHAVVIDGGRVAEVRMYFDVYGFLSQLGLIGADTAV